MNTNALLSRISCYFTWFFKHLFTKNKKPGASTMLRAYLRGLKVEVD